MRGHESIGILIDVLIETGSLCMYCKQHVTGKSISLAVMSLPKLLVDLRCTSALRKSLRSMVRSAFSDYATYFHSKNLYAAAERELCIILHMHPSLRNYLKYTLLIQN